MAPEHLYLFPPPPYLSLTHPLPIPYFYAIELDLIEICLVLFIKLMVSRASLGAVEQRIKKRYAFCSGAKDEGPYLKTLLAPLHMKNDK